MTAPFTPAQRTTLDALCGRLVPTAAPAELSALVEQRLFAGDPALARDVARLLTLFDHPFAGLLGGPAGRFTRLASAAQDARLDRWAESGLGLQRTAFQAFRRLVLTTHYAQPAVQAALGYRGPFHDRAPTLPSEGTLPGHTDDGEPVARGARLERPPVRRRAPPGLAAGSTADGTVLRAGVCVIGTGAGGAVAAARLAEAGHDVVILEEGGWWTAADFTEREHEMVPRLYADAGMRATDDLGVTLLQGRSVGGGTTVNWMLMLRPPEPVLDEWRALGAEGFGAAELAPVFDEIEAETHTRLVPPDAHSAQNCILLDGARRLGWRTQAGRINAHGCVRSGFCGLGCRYDAKQGMHLTFVPRALAAGARLFTDARALRVEVVERGGPAPLKRVHVEALDRETGRARARFTVEAPLVVLAGGAVGTPALLQRSGLGGGGVGRFLRLHPTSAVVGCYEHEVYGTAGIPQSSLCDEFLAGTGGDGYGSWIEAAPLYPALAAAAVPGYGAAHRAVMEAFPRLGTLIVLVRDGADRRRSDGEVRVDRGGRVRIRYRLGERVRRELAAGLAAAARIHLAAGATEALTLHHRAARVRTEADLALLAALPYGANRLGLFSAHVNGTCRLGTDPRTSGCGPDGERHGVPGLYVADGSLLPTAPGVNPQETIMALATVVARRMVERHRPG